MASIGLNVSADGRHTAAFVRALNATWVRIVHRQEFDVSSRLADYQAAGIKTMLVFDRTSIEMYPSDQEAFQDALARYRQYVSLWQVGNEPDGSGPSSWTMDPHAFTELGLMARHLLPGRLIVAGGMVSGQPDWLTGQDLSWCDLISIHPYLKDATPDNDLPDVDVLIRQYMALGKPTMVSEWGWWGDDETRGRAEIDDMVGWAAKTNLIPLFFHFCADDAMVAPFGLYRADGKPKSAVSAFTAQARGAIAGILPTPAPGPMPVPVPVPTPIPIPPSPAPDPSLPALEQAYAALWRAHLPTLAYTPSDAAVVPSLQKAWRANHQAWGSPITGEIPDDDGSVLMTFAVAGPMRWTGGDSVEAA